MLGGLHSQTPSGHNIGSSQYQDRTTDEKLCAKVIARENWSDQLIEYEFYSYGVHGNLILLENDNSVMCSYHVSLNFYGDNPVVEFILEN
jgi:hypothetical protein